MLEIVHSKRGVALSLSFRRPPNYRRVGIRRVLSARSSHMRQLAH
ncbi:hypothetical protein M3J09_007112 [Ascochyta lentis]